MTISKALRFEVLRRDGFACTYCGRKPPDVELHIDHVTPTALGGQDIPENLRTSCMDCNAGKGSTPPEAQLVAQVADDADRWAAAIRQAATEMAAHHESGRWFVDLWLSAGLHEARYLPADAEQRVAQMMARGLPREVIEAMFWVAVGARHVAPWNEWAYFVGCCNRRLEELHTRAAELVEEEGTD